jgi:hypothetical protein
VPDAGRQVDGRPDTLDALGQIGHGHLAAAVLADQGRGDALSQLRGRVRRLVEPAVGVRVHVDEAGGHDPPGSVDDALAAPGCQRRPNLHDDVAFDADVGGARGASGAVNEAAVADEQPGSGLLCHDSHGATEGEQRDDEGAALVICFWPLRHREHREMAGRRTRTQPGTRLFPSVNSVPLWQQGVCVSFWWLCGPDSIR